jgi:hypothetical protein
MDDIEERNPVLAKDRQITRVAGIKCGVLSRGSLSRMLCLEPCCQQRKTLGTNDTYLAPVENMPSSPDHSACARVS